MLRALVLVVAFFLFRSMFANKRQRSAMAMSPYMNSLDGAMTAEQISRVLDDLARLPKGPVGRSSGARSLREACYPPSRFPRRPL
jgi:hypothetical protein